MSSSLEISRNNLETGKNNHQQQGEDVLSFPRTLRCAFDDEDDECHEEERNEVLRLHRHESDVNVREIQKPPMPSPQQQVCPLPTCTQLPPPDHQQKSSIGVAKQVEEPSAQNKQHNNIYESSNAHQGLHHHDQKCTALPAIVSEDNEAVTELRRRRQSTKGFSNGNNRIIEFEKEEENDIGIDPMVFDRNYEEVSAQSHSTADGEAFTANRDCEEGGDAAGTFTPKDDADSTPRTYRNLFVSRLPLRVQHEDLAQLFAPYNARTATIMTDAKTGRSKGFGFVLFDTEEEGIIAHNALNKAKIVIKGVTLVLRTLPSKHDADKDKGIQVSPVLYVRNVPKSATKEDVERMLESFGSVIFCAMREEPDGLPVWVVLVEYDCQQCADNALSHLRHNTSLYPGRRPPVIAKYAKAMDRRRHPQKAGALPCPFRSGASLQTPANTAIWSDQTHITAMNVTRMHVNTNYSSANNITTNMGTMVECALPYGIGALPTTNNESYSNAATFTLATAQNGRQTHVANSNVSLFAPQTIPMPIPAATLQHQQQKFAAAAVNFGNDLSLHVASRYVSSNSGTLVSHGLHQGTQTFGNNEERAHQPYGELVGLVSANNTTAQHLQSFGNYQNQHRHGQPQYLLHPQASITPTTTSFSSPDTSNMSPTLLSASNPTGTAHNNLSTTSTIHHHHHHHRTTHQQDLQLQKRQEVYLYSGDVGGGCFSGPPPSSRVNNSVGGQTSASYENITMPLPTNNFSNATTRPFQQVSSTKVDPSRCATSALTQSQSSAPPLPPHHPQTHLSSYPSASPLFFSSLLNSNTNNNYRYTTNEVNNSSSSGMMNINMNQIGVGCTSDTINRCTAVPIVGGTTVGHGTLFHQQQHDHHHHHNFSNNNNNNANSNGLASPSIISGACLPHSKNHTAFPQPPPHPLLHSLQIQQQVLNQPRETVHEPQPQQQQQGHHQQSHHTPYSHHLSQPLLQIQQQLRTVPDASTASRAPPSVFNQASSSGNSSSSSPLSPPFVDRSGIQYQQQLALNLLPQEPQHQQQQQQEHRVSSNSIANNQFTAAFGDVHQISRMVAGDNRIPTYLYPPPIMSTESRELIRQQQQQQQRDVLQGYGGGPQPPPTTMQYPLLFLQQQQALSNPSESAPPHSLPPPPAYVHPHNNNNQNNPTAMSFAHLQHQQQQ